MSPPVKPMLSATQVDEFTTRGFTTVPNFFNRDEVAALQLEVGRFIDERLYRDVSTKPEVRQNCQLIPLFPHSDLFKSVPFAPKVISAVEQLVGIPIVKILDQMFYKPPLHGMGTN